jgi:biotin carboxylase
MSGAGVDRARPLVVLVGCGVMGTGYLRAAEALGFDIGLVETPERVARLRTLHPVVVDAEPVTTDWPDLEEGWLAPAATLAERLDPDGLLGFSEPQVKAAGLLQQRLGLRGPGLAAVVMSRDKALQRAEFARRGVPQPDHLLVPEPREAHTWVRGRFPVVVKALSGTGSDGVELVPDEPAWADLLERRRGPVLVEEFVDSQEYSVEALVENGVVRLTNLTCKRTTGPPHFVELLHETAFQEVEPATAKVAREITDLVTLAMGVEHAVLSVEFRAGGDREPAVMEAMVRTPGDHIMELLSRTYGYDWFAATLSMAVGAPVQDAPEGPTRACASRYLVADREGVVLDDPLDSVRALPGVARANMGVAFGDRVRPPRGSADRLAVVILDCADRDALRGALAETERSAIGVGER